MNAVTIAKALGGRKAGSGWLTRWPATTTVLTKEIAQHAKRLAAESGVAVTMMVIDHTRLAMAGDPNDAEDVTQPTRVLTSIAQHTGSAVFSLGHSPKSGLTGNEVRHEY